MFNFKNDKYLIFLQDRFFKKHWFKSYKKVIKSLENNGITVMSNTEIIEYQSFMNNPLIFDDKNYPELNCLYIHLYNGIYYNDSIYVKKKIEKEREMLLLLAGKLGVREMSYSSATTETSIANIEASISIKGIETKAQYTKNKTVKDSTSGHEIYQNRGASVYLNSKTREEMDKNILNSLSTMKSKIFSYDYYKNSPKLESFVYKRFVFKMLHLEYTIDVEDISEKSFIVKSCLMSYGLGVRIDKSTSTSETITFKFDFFNDKELRIQLMESIRKENDEFVSIREVYDEAAKTNKDLAVHYIANYVRSLALEMKLKKNKKNYKYSLNKWIKENGLGQFYDICHYFTNSMQIKEWIKEIATMLNGEKYKEEEHISSDEESDINSIDSVISKDSTVEICHNEKADDYSHQNKDSAQENNKDNSIDLNKEFRKKLKSIFYPSVREKTNEQMITNQTTL